MEITEIKEECKYSGDPKVKDENSSSIVYEVEITSTQKIKLKEEAPSQNPTTSVTNEEIQNTAEITIKSDPDPLSSVVYEVEVTSTVDINVKEEHKPQSPPSSVTIEETQSFRDIRVNSDQNPLNDEMELEPQPKNTTNGESIGDSNEEQQHQQISKSCQSSSIKNKGNGSKIEKMELLECTLCPQSFERVGALIKHARIEHASIKNPGSDPISGDDDEASSQCPLCSKSLASFRCLQTHFGLFHVKNKPFQCSVCLESKNEVKKFPTETFLKRHIARVHNPARFKFKCDICPMKFRNLLEYENHKETHLEKKYKCEYCSNGFRKKERMLRHIIAVHKEYCGRYETFKCELCEQLFCSKKDLEFHVLQTHVKDTVQCKICFKKFTDEVELSKHFKVSHKEIRTWLVCDVCSKVFKNNQVLVKHLEVEHQRFFKCRKCFRSFVSKEDYDSHSAETLDEEGRIVEKPQLQCKICYVFLNTECSFTTHKDTHLKTGEIESKIALQLHPEVVQEHFIKCDFCPKTFFQKSLLLEHASECHPNEKWECKSCYKSFKLKYQLVKHELLHSTRKPFTCKVCFKSFTVHSYLTAHLETHKKVKRYQCSQCKKYFAGSARLKLHRANHHGAEKPFKCDICQKAFAIKREFARHLMRHQQKVHQENPTARKRKRKGSNNPVRFGPRLKYFDDMVFVCALEKCNFETKDEKEVAIHNAMHGLPLLVLSRELPLSTFVKATLEQHSSTMGTAEEIKTRTVQPQIKCRYCFKVYKYSYSYRKHVRHFHRNAQYTGSISVHDDYTNYPVYFNPVHHGAKSKYAENLVFVCSVTECDFETKDEKKVAIHYAEHNLPKVNVPRLLPGPSYQLFLLKSAPMHKHMIHARYKCAHCLKTMCLPGSLRQHIRTFHEDKKN